MATEAFDTATEVAGLAAKRQFRALFDEIIPFKMQLEEDSVADQAGSNAVVTVPGAALGDFVMIGWGADLTNMTYSASVISAGVVEVQVHNLTGAAATGLATVSTCYGICLRPSAELFGNL